MFTVPGQGQRTAATGVGSDDARIQLVQLLVAAGADILDTLEITLTQVQTGLAHSQTRRRLSRQAGFGAALIELRADLYRRRKRRLGLPVCTRPRAAGLRRHAIGALSPTDGFGAGL